MSKKQAKATKPSRAPKPSKFLYVFENSCFDILADAIADGTAEDGTVVDIYQFWERKKVQIGVPTLK